MQFNWYRLQFKKNDNRTINNKWTTIEYKRSTDNKNMTSSTVIMHQSDSIYNDLQINNQHMKWNDAMILWWHSIIIIQ